jgi:hypothetical protein
MRHALALAAVALAASCTVPDKYLTDPDGGDDVVDGGGGVDAPGPDAEIDTTAPETTITSAPPEYHPAALAEFEFESSEEGSTFLCSFDGETPTACTSPYSRSLADGPHTFSVRASDAAGNQDETPAEHVWQHDTVPPTTTITDAPAAIDNSTSVSFEFTSNETGATFECALDGGAYAACTSPATYDGLTDGSHSFAVRAIDLAGNEDEIPATHGWTIDTSTPDTVIDSGPTGTVTSTTATFTFSSPDAGAGATFECSLDGAAFATCTSPRTYTSLSETSHTFAVRVRDSGGNVDPSPADVTWSIDATAPTTTITAAPSGAVNSASGVVEFGSNEAGTFQCALDGGAYATCTSPHLLSGLAQGAHSIAVRAIDLAGNVDASPATASWTVDTVLPDTTIGSAPSGAVNSTTATFTFSANEAGATFECSIDGAAFATCTSPRSYTGLSEGSHMFAVRARDAATNVDPTPATASWSIDVTAPTTMITAAPSGAVSSTSANVEFSSNEGGTFQCSLDGAAFTACTSPRTFSGLSQGSHTFAVRAVDTAGNADATPATASWTVDTVPPDTTFAATPTNPSNSGAATFSMTSNEAPVTYLCALDSASPSACSSPHTITAPDGSRTFRAYAVDAAGNVDPSAASYSWTVDSTAPVVTISTGPTNGSTSGPYVTFAFSVDDPSATVTCQVNGGPQVSCSGSYTFNVGEGPAMFKVEARDQFSRVGTAERSWTVDCVPPTGGPGAMGLFHFEDDLLVQTVDNSLAGTDAFRGLSMSMDLADPAVGMPGRYGRGFRFATTQDADTVTWSPGATASVSQFTVEMWIRPEVADGLVQDLFYDSNYHFALYQAPTPGQVRIEMQIQDDGDVYNYISSDALALNQWHHVVATFAAGTMTLWVNGTATSQTGIARTTPFEFNTVRIGTSQTSNSTRAGIDEVFVGNQAFTATNVLSRYCPIGAEPPPACPTSYQTIAGQAHKYLGVDAATSWSSAASNCAAELPGWTYLAVPDNSSEMNALSASFPGPRWIGYNDQAFNNEWRTMLGDEPLYFNWESGEPNGGDAIWYNSSGRWRDDPVATSSSFYVCECAGQ